MIQVHLYGKLRRFAADSDPRAPSVARVPWEAGDCVEQIVNRIGIPHDQLGSNLFVEGRYATLETPVKDNARLGLFPDDMQLLYRWYFSPSHSSEDPNRSDDVGGASRQDDSRALSRGSEDPNRSVNVGGASRQDDSRVLSHGSEDPNRSLDIGGARQIRAMGSKSEG